jgi:metal-responsive CopG/Arc/MetJ family transcriptional regulator
MDDTKNRQSLRLEQYLWKAIDEMCKQRPGKISRNTWITEAITEKLEREQKQQAKKDGNDPNV